MTISSTRAHAPRLDGFIDRCARGRVIGWAVDPSAPDRPLTVTVSVDGVPQASALADLPRADLLKAGYAGQHHGFEIRLPQALFDGRAHEITVGDARSGATLAGGARSFDLEVGLGMAGRIDGVENGMIVGALRDAGTPDAPVPFELREDGRSLGRGEAAAPAPDGFRWFAIRPPAEICDGRVHALEIWADGLVAADALFLPAAAVPGRLAADPRRAPLPFAAARRYAALAASLRAEARGGGAADLAAAHDILASAGPAGPTAQPPAPSEAPLFSFPEQSEPEASILLPAHNEAAFTLHCLASLRLARCETSFEVVLLDDGSTDATTEMERLVGGLRVVRRETPLGFLRNVNAGAAAARGRRLVLLNNDTEVGLGWLDHLLRPFTMFDDVGLVGAKLLFGDGVLQEAGGAVWRDGSVWNYGRGGNPHDPKYDFLRDADYCSGACVAIDRALWDSLGGFDETFLPAYFEDTDLAFRVRAAGRRVVYQPLCEIVHFEGVSSGSDMAAGIKRHQALNHPKFLERWYAEIRGNGVPGAEPHRAVERAYARRALVIDSETPEPDTNAGHYAAVQEIRLLQSLGFRPTFLPSNCAYAGSYTDALRETGVECVHAPFALTPGEFLAERGREFDLVYVTRYAVARDLLPAIRAHCPGARLVFNTADLHFLREIRGAIAAKAPEAIAAAAEIRAQELGVIEAADLTLTYNEAEQAVIQSHLADRAQVMKCPWVARTHAEPPPFEARRDVVYLGGFRHPPNVEAAAFFIREVMPGLRQAAPGLRFRIFGSYPPPELEALAGEDVVVEGWVERLADVFDHARIFVAPLLSGAGLNGKVIEALAHGVSSVLSPIAAEATGVRDGREAFVVETPEDWVDRILRLDRDAALWARMSAEGRGLVAEAYSFERGRTRMRAALESVGLLCTPGPHPR